MRALPRARRRAAAKGEIAAGVVALLFSGCLAGAPQAQAVAGWSAPVSAHLNGLPGTGLTGVSCPSASFCMALGLEDFYAYEAQKPYGVTETFNGSAWSVPARLELQEAAPGPLSCASASFCVALDSFAQAFTYDGAAWSAPDKLAGTVEEPRAVSCASSSFCVAIADVGPSSEDEYQPPGSGALAYNGSSWSNPVTVETNVATLYSVSCPSVSFCAAVGGGPEEPADAVIYDDGSWSPVSRLESPGHELDAVSCASPSFCVAVDESGNALTYNGRAWSAARRIAPATGGRELQSVSCPTSSFCAAVGQASTGGGDALIYNGSAWSAPATVDGAGGLDSVSCVSASFCIATDEHGDTISYGVGGPPPPASGSEARPSLSVHPRAARAGRRVHVSGSVGSFDGQLDCPAGDQVELLSHAFTPSRREFGGVPTVYGKVGRNGRFSARAAIPRRRRPGIYTISGRCGGANLGIAAKLRVLARRRGRRR